MDDPTTGSSAEYDFYRGEYKAVLNSLGYGPLEPGQPSFETNTFYQIGALVFLGELKEAETLYQRALRKVKLSDLFICQCRFFLGIGSVRISQYSEAAVYFAKNRLLHKKLSKSQPNLSHKLSFFALQGSAFYRFYRGQYSRSNQLASSAYMHAYEEQFLYGQVLSLDLLGHSYCKSGLVHKGLSELQKALGFANKIGNGSIINALKFSLVKYKAQFGVDLKGSFNNLKITTEQHPPGDTYSLAELYLELTRQQTIRGQGEAAQKTLEKAGPLIYKHQNKRQSAIYSLRYAHIQLLNGDLYLALSQAQALKSHLNRRIDIDLLKQTDGLINKINSYIKSSSKLKLEHLNKLLRLSNEKSTATTVARDNLQQDSIGYAIFKANQKKSGYFYELKNNGLNSLIPKVLGVPLGARGIYLGPSRRELVILAGSDVICVDRGVTKPIKVLIRKLVGEKFKSKEFLVHKVWGYYYDPTMHDALLQATIAKLRAILGRYANWVEWSNNGYRLRNDIFIFEDEDKLSKNAKIITNEKKSKVTGKLPEKSVKNNSISGLNIRQVKYLGTLKRKDITNVRSYAEDYGVTTMTAYRDLNYLHQAGKVLRIGKGRSTVYASLESIGELK